MDTDYDEERSLSPNPRDSGIQKGEAEHLLPPGRSKKILCFPFGVVELAILFTCFTLSLLCGTPNAFVLVSSDIESDLSLGSTQMDLISSFGLVGLFFTVPAGMLYDAAGESKTIFLCGTLASLSYIAMSFCGSNTWYLMMLCFTITGFGSGGAFTALLGCGIKTLGSNPGFAISFVGAGMSLSMGFTSLVFYVVNSICDDNNLAHCWRTKLQVLGILLGIMSIVVAGVLKVLLEKKEQASRDVLIFEERNTVGVLAGDSDDHSAAKYSERDDYEDDFSSMSAADPPPPLSFKQKLGIVNNRFYWTIEFSYMIGIGACLVVIVNMDNIWKAFLGGKSNDDTDEWVFYISLLFSLVNAFVGGLTFGTVADHLVKRGHVRSRVLAALFLVFTVVFYAIGVLSAFSGHQMANGLAVLLAILMISVGVLFGACVNTFPTMIGEYYDVRYFGVYLGFLQIGSAASTFVVPALCTVNYDLSGDYATLCAGFSVLLFISACLLFLVPPPTKM